MICVTQKEVDDLVEIWQPLLRLSHWKIVVRLKRREDIGDDCLGFCDYTIPRLEAVIKLLDNVDYPKSCVYEQDHEITLVHELLHLWFCQYMIRWDTTDQYGEYLAQEQTVEVLATALVELRRAGIMTHDRLDEVLEMQETQVGIIESYTRENAELREKVAELNISLRSKQQQVESVLEAKNAWMERATTAESRVRDLTMAAKASNPAVAPTD